MENEIKDLGMGALALIEVASLIETERDVDEQSTPRTHVYSKLNHRTQCSDMIVVIDFFLCKERRIDGELVKKSML